MSRALFTAATGMIAQQMNVDNIANNLANVNTTGYKKSKLEFQDLLYQQLRMAGATQAEGAQVPVELQIGYGTRPVATQRIFSQETIILTSNPMDVSIDGDGFLQVTLPDGTTAYTRDGALKLSSEGVVVTSDGYPLEPQITIPQDIRNSERYSGAFRYAKSNFSPRIERIGVVLEKIVPGRSVVLSFHK